LNSYFSAVVLIVMGLNSYYNSVIHILIRLIIFINILNNKGYN